MYTQEARDALLGDREAAAFVSEVEDGLTRLPKGAEVDISSATIHAIRRGAADVGSACLLTSLTTFVGFAALSLVPTPVFRHVGIVLGFGVGVALFLAMTLLPVLFSFMSRPKPWRTGGTGKPDLLERIIVSARRVALARPWRVIAAFAVVLVIVLFGTTRMHVETDITKRLASTNQVRVDARYFAQNFSATNMIDIYIEAPEDGGALEPDLFSLACLFIDYIKMI